MRSEFRLQAAVLRLGGRVNAELRTGFHSSPDGKLIAIDIVQDGVKLLACHVETTRIQLPPQSESLGKSPGQLNVPQFEQKA
jgi:hypothetical protein